MSGAHTANVHGVRVQGGSRYRVALAPHTDLFMRGARYGTLERVGRKWLHVRLDATGRIVRLSPSALSDAWPS
jgi:hypothetical protein